MSRALFPPLEWIAADLGAATDPSEPGPEAFAAGANSVMADAPPVGSASIEDSAPPEMPDYLRDMVRRRVQSQAAHADAPLSVGQIRLIRSIASARGPGQPLGRSCGILLGASLGPQYWSGWLVAQEADYACDRDLLLEENKGPIAPEAAMVQTWNPVRCWLRGDEPVLGKVAPLALAAVLELADQQAPSPAFVAPRPGRIGVRSLSDGTQVLTGTPLGGQEDPRRVYQQLYGALAQAVSAAADLSTQVSSQVRPQRFAPSGLLAWLQERWVRPGWGLAALALLLAQSLWIAAGLFPRQDESQVYRGAGQVYRSDPCAPRLRVVFKAGAAYADVVVDLRRIEGSVVDGPSELGEVWIELRTELQAQQAARILRLSKAVQSADLSAAPQQGCPK